jgi:hypothetical protein
MVFHILLEFVILARLTVRNWEVAQVGYGYIFCLGPFAYMCVACVF